MLHKLSYLTLHLFPLCFCIFQRIFPYVLAMVGNGTISYDHERDGRPTELGGCNAMVRNLKHDTFLFIRYVRRRLTVRTEAETCRIWNDAFVD